MIQEHRISLISQLVILIQFNSSRVVKLLASNYKILNGLDLHRVIYNVWMRLESQYNSINSHEAMMKDGY